MQLLELISNYNYVTFLLGIQILIDYYKSLYQVNIFTTRCNERSRSKVYCNQAVAIRSGRTHYIWDKIGEGPGRDSYLDCDENDLRFTVHGNTKSVSMFKRCFLTKINCIVGVFSFNGSL